MQKDPQHEDRLLPVSFFSQRLNSAERKYSTIHREAMAIHATLDANRSWLLGAKIYLFTDHRPLHFIMNSEADAGRLTRWKYLLQEFNPSIHYIPGETNHIADYLSRFSEGP